jgi:hypothetical protein
MQNSVSDVNSAWTPSCSIDDVEICERGIDEISYVDKDGLPTDHKETYMGEAETAYYYCDDCGEDWVVNAVQSQEQAWKLVKEHLSE